MITVYQNVMMTFSMLLMPSDTFMPVEATCIFKSPRPFSFTALCPLHTRKVATVYRKSLKSPLGLICKIEFLRWGLIRGKGLFQILAFSSKVDLEKRLNFLYQRN